MRVWFVKQAKGDLNAEQSVELLRAEKGMGGTGFAAKNIVNAIAACDAISKLNLFPGLQGDQRVCGPKARELLAIVEPYQNPKDRHQRRVLRSG